MLNVVYGKKIGNMLDGCCVGVLFVLGVNLMYGCDEKGVVVFLIFVGKLLFVYVKDGIFYIFFIVLNVLGKDENL